MQNKLIKQVIRENVELCVKCGKCKSVCDMYKYLKEEQYSPRGLVQLAKVVIENNISPGIQISSYFNTCFLCLKCSLKCPLDVNIVNTIILTRNLLNTQEDILKNINKLTDKKREHHLLNLFEDKPTSGFRKFYEKAKKSKMYNLKSKTLIIPSCFQDFELIDFLDKNRIQFIIAEEIHNAGYFHLAIGDLKTFETISDKNRKFVIENGIKKILVSCPHCFYTLTSHYELPDTEVDFIELKEKQFCPINVLAYNNTGFQCQGFGGLLDILNPEIFSRLKKKGYFKPKCSLSKGVK